MATPLEFSGWTASTVSPTVSTSSPAQVGMVLKDPKLASRGVQANALATAPPEVKTQIAATTPAGQPTLQGSSALEWLDFVQKNPVSADQLILSPGGVKDTKLASRKTASSPLTNIRNVEAQVSTFQSGNPPQDILNQIQALNKGQAQRRAEHQGLITDLQQRANAGDVFAAEALRAAAVQPGSAVSFGSRILTPYESLANTAAATASANLMASQSRQITSAERTQKRLIEAQQRRAQLGSPIMGGYVGSEQEKLDREIMALRRSASSTSPEQQRAVSASGARSGWTAPIY